jgi:UDP-N-acetylmuramoyl-tripeptide--D-alanyl-D-alanine ligase
VARVVKYGFADDAEVRGENVTSAGLDGMRFTLRINGERRPAAIPALGRLSVHNALAAAAVGRAAGLTPDEIVTGLAGGWAAEHRVAVVRLGSIAVIDDTYNASPGSVTAALDLLAGLPGRRVAVLGEMLELGEGSDDGHRAVGKAAARTVDWLVVVGRGAAGIALGATEAGLDPARIVQVPDPDAALVALVPRLRPGDVVLVKASRGIALESIVDGLRRELGESAAR